jgi:nucleotide-binding universal stress UspA family protein
MSDAPEVTGEIVVGYDGTDAAKAALAEAVRLAKGLSLPVRLCFGFEAPAFLAGEAGRQRDVIEGIGTKALEEGLATATSLDASVSVTAETVSARPAEAIIAMAERDDARMIVVGHHEGGTVRGAIMGSVTFKVLHGAPCPVLVVAAPD